MASTDRRADSPFTWIRYKSSSSAWKSANIGYRQDKKQAELLAKGKSLEEIVATKPTAAYDSKWATSFITGDVFTKLVYAGA